MTTGWERLQYLFADLKWIIGPQHSGDFGWLFFVGFIVLVILCRKAFRGTFKAFFKVLGLLLFLFILNSISTKVMVGFLVFGAMAWLFKGYAGLLKGAGIVLVTVIAILLAVANNFLV